VAAGDKAAAQVTLGEEDGGGGGLGEMGIPNQSMMSRNQWKRFKERAKKMQGRI
jgi:hypothetical protein